MASTLREELASLKIERSEFIRPRGKAMVLSSTAAGGAASVCFHGCSGSSR